MTPTSLIAAAAGSIGMGVVIYLLIKFARQSTEDDPIRDQWKDKYLPSKDRPDA